MTTYCIDVCGEESNIRQHNIPFEQLRDTLRDLLDQYHRITGEPINGNDVDDEARNLLANCLIDAANKGIQPTHDNPMSAGEDSWKYGRNPPRKSTSSSYRPDGTENVRCRSTRSRPNRWRNNARGCFSGTRKGNG